MCMCVAACVFSSYHTPLLLTPTSLHCALILPRLPGFPLLTRVSSGDVTYATSPLCTYSTGNTEDRKQYVSWFFRQRQEKTKGSPEAVYQVQNSAEKKVNMDY